MSEILKRIQTGEILLADGAVGTELIKRCLPTGSCPENYNITHPNIIQSIYADYFRAGSDIVETNTFGANYVRLAAHNLENKVRELNIKAAELACQIRPNGKYVAGSVGPTGETLEPIGTLASETAYAYFREQATALAEGGVDIIFIETMMAVEEAELAVKAVTENTSLPVSATMTFEKNPAGLFTSFGVTPKIMTEQLTAAGAHILGVNCGNGVEIVIEIVKKLNTITDLPILVQPNAGLPEVKNGKLIYSETAKSMAASLKDLFKYNIGILGGCCGTGPDYIREMRKLIDQFLGKR